MKKVILGVVVLFSVFVGACAAPLNTPTPTAAAKSGKIRFALNGAPNAYDVMWLMANDDLKAQGYDVEIVNFANSNLIVPALVNGDVDIAAANSNLAWAAIAKNADIRTIVSRVNNAFYLATVPAITTCQQLDGKVLGFSTTQSVGYLMFQKYLKDNCPGTTPKYLLISESNNRLAALQTGQLDGAYLQIEDWLALNTNVPNQYHILLDFGRAFPQIQYSTYSVRRTWAEQNPQLVRDFIRALLIANRTIIGNSSRLQSEFVKRYNMDPAQAKRVADTYLDLGVWDANGGLTQTNLVATLDFLVASGSVPAGLQVQNIADLSYLNAVLSEIGRK